MFCMSCENGSQAKDDDPIYAFPWMTDEYLRGFLKDNLPDDISPMRMTRAELLTWFRANITVDLGC